MTVYHEDPPEPSEDPDGFKAYGYSGSETVRAAIERAASRGTDVKETLKPNSNGHDQEPPGYDPLFDFDEPRTGHQEEPKQEAPPPRRELPAKGVSIRDFSAYMPDHNYIYKPTRQTWPGSSVNSRIPPVPLLDETGAPILDKKGEPQKISASAWLDKNSPVEQMTWAPGLPMLIRHRLVSEGGWIDHANVTCFNLYRPPRIQPGDPAKAGKWIDHVKKIYPDDADHIIRFLAHRVQRPQEKINHALVLGGNQGIGKDTLLEPAKYAVGPWNFGEVSPSQTLGRFNGFLKSVILRINEAKDMGETDRFKFYDHLKAYTAAPPDVLRVDEKNLREHCVFNICGVIITTNHKTDGIYLPADDRRHFVAWSEFTKEDFTEAYWKDKWDWYERQGLRHVAAYLSTLDLSDFNPKAPPPKTPAFWDIVDANRAPEDAELADILDALKNPDAITLIRIQNQATGDFEDWIKDRRNRRVIPHRLEKCGYVPVRNAELETRPLGDQWHPSSYLRQSRIVAQGPLRGRPEARWREERPWGTLDL